MRVIGFLNSAPKGAQFAGHVAAFRAGLKETGCVEGKDVRIVFKWAQGKYTDLPKLAADLVKRGVDVIATTGGTVSAQAAVWATKYTKSTKPIPVLFVSGFDPGKAGLLKGGNSKGVHVATTESVPKRLAMLRKLVPGAKKIAVLLRPGTFVYRREKEHAKKAKLMVVEARGENDFRKAFAKAVKKGAGALIVCADPFFTSHRKKLIALAAAHGLPAAYPWREYVDQGGLMSFGPNLIEAYRDVGVHAGNIVRQYEHRGPRVKKHKVSDFELVINRKTAGKLNLAIPQEWYKLAEVV